MIKSIVCVNNDWAIGKNNTLLYSLPKDMAHFRTTTEHQIVVMGYNTLLSLPKGKPLKNRVNIVICPEGIEPKDCIVFHNFTKMMDFIQILAKEFDVYICGGQMLYSSTVDYIDEAVITKVDDSVEDATAYFPNLDLDDRFEVVKESAKTEDSGYNIKLVVYRRK